MPKLPDLVARLRLDTTDLNRAERQVQGFAKSSSRAFGGLGRSIVAAGGVGALGAFAKNSVEAAGEARKVALQTDAVIKSTGGVAGISAKHIADLSSKLKDHSTFEDEAIQNASNLLLTFQNIKGEPIFDRANQAVVDLSTLMKGDLQGAAIQVGKALNDPVAGIAALSRIGITFEPEQKKVIAGLVAIGDTAGAQTYILGIIEQQIGGQAQAARDARTPVEELRVKWEEVQEKVGEIILNQLPAFNAGLKEISTWPGDFRRGLDTISAWEAPSWIKTILEAQDALFSISGSRTGNLGEQTGKLGSPSVGSPLPFPTVIASDQPRRRPARWGFGFHEGGPVRGKGEVPAVLQSGEYVIRRSAVARVGRAALDQINRAPVAKLEEDAAPATSPAGAPLSSFTAGRAVYADGRVFTALGWGGLRFKPNARLDTSQVIDLRRVPMTPVPRPPNRFHQGGMVGTSQAGPAGGAAPPIHFHINGEPDGYVRALLVQTARAVLASSSDDLGRRFASDARAS